MRRFKTKFFILLLAFFLGIIAFKVYLFLTSQQVKDQIIEKESISVTEEQVPQANDFFTAELCKEDVDTSTVLPTKKEKKQSIVGEGVFKLGNVNSLVLCGSLPDYPAAIKSKVSGLVNIEVKVDKTGRVISAKIINGPNGLLKESLESAFQTRFNPYYGRYSGPFYFEGILTYEFNSDHGVRLYKPSRWF